MKLSLEPEICLCTVQRVNYFPFSIVLMNCILKGRYYVLKQHTPKLNFGANKEDRFNQKKIGNR